MRNHYILISIERLCDLFKQSQMTSGVTEVNYLEVAEELCIHVVLPIYVPYFIHFSNVFAN